VSLVWELAVAASLIYFVAINATYTVLTITSFIQTAFRTRQAEATNFDILLRSGLTPPVSIVIPAHNEEPVILDSVTTALAVDYPEFEVIVVNDGSTDRTLRRLIDAFGLEGSEQPYRATLPSTTVRRIYTSRSHPRLRVVDKEKGGKSDALNAGVNVARFRYICNTDADTLFEKEALLRIIRPVVRDPRRVVAVGGQVRIGNGFRVVDGKIVERRLATSLLPVFQVVEYLRTFLGNRVGWSAVNSMLLISGAFGLWRRDTLVSVGGFNRDITGEDLELTLRIHRVLRQRGEEYKVLALPDPVCWTEAPDDVRSLYAQRNRWHRVLLESFGLHREMLLNPFYGTPGMVGMPYYFFFEIVGPFLEVFSYLVVATGFMLGFVEPQTVLLFLMLSMGWTTVLNMAALLIEEIYFQSYTDLRDVAKLLAVGFLDNLGYRQFTMAVRVVATFDWLTRTRAWGEITRAGYGDEGVGGMGGAIGDRASPAAPLPPLDPTEDAWKEKAPVSSGNGATGSRSPEGRGTRV
jgi:cellulose synthase/poly-beta-1,6-N-acetylglucosamine synthase-like glycosyltransferase